MKNKILLYSTLLYMISVAGMFPQTYTCTIQNQSVDGNEFSFDIYIQRTDEAEIYLGSSEFSIEFNNQYFINPAISYQKGSGLNWYTVATSIPSGYLNVVKFSIGSLFFSNQIEFDERVFKPSTTVPGSLVATFTISADSILTSGTAGLHWRIVAPHNNKINSYAQTSPWNQTNITEFGTYEDPFDIPLPVELTSFTATAGENYICLSWQTKSEVNNSGFSVEKRMNGSEWNTIGFVEGSGNSTSPKEYRFIDNDLFLGASRFQYRLKQTDTDGSFNYSDIVDVSILPDQYELSQNYPNPFNPATTIRFSLPEKTDLKIDVYNMLGQLIETLAQGIYEAGYHKIKFNASSLASGFYIYRVESSEFTQVRKMVLIK